jgi:hypothetical protein
LSQCLIEQIKLWSKNENAAVVVNLEWHLKTSLSNNAAVVVNLGNRALIINNAVSVVVSRNKRGPKKEQFLTRGWLC